LHTGPGGAGLTVGENELGPPPVTAFSVGDGAGSADVVVGVVVVGNQGNLPSQATRPHVLSYLSSVEHKITQYRVHQEIDRQPGHHPAIGLPPLLPRCYGERR